MFGDGPPTIFIGFLIVVGTAVLFVGAVCLGVWIGGGTSTNDGNLHGRVAGKTVTTLQGDANAAKAYTDALITAIQSQAAAGTQYVTYINIDMRFKD